MIQIIEEKIVLKTLEVELFGELSKELTIENTQVKIENKIETKEVIFHPNITNNFVID